MLPDLRSLWRVVVFPRGVAVTFEDGKLDTPPPSRVAHIFEYDSLIVDSRQFEQLWPKKDRQTDRARRRFLKQAEDKRVVDRDLIKGLQDYRSTKGMPQFSKIAAVSKRLWQDPVWSKVIATGITAGISGLAALWFFGAGLHTDHAPPSTNQHPVPANTLYTERTNPAPTPAPQAPAPDADRPIAWRSDLSFWSGGGADGASLLGVVIRGTITDAAPVQLTDAYIISEITGEKKALQVELAPGPRLASISDINQIPPKALLQLWATFSPPGISPTDFVTHWGSFRLHAEYAGIKCDKVFSREAVQSIMQLQFPEVGPHVTPKG